MKPGTEIPSRVGVRRPPGLPDKARRAAWHLAWLLLYRLSPVPFHFWRRFLLRLFGATIEGGAHPYPSARIWAPWNLAMRRNSCLGSEVECYNVDRVTLCDGAVVSQRTFICTAGHDYDSPDFALLSGPVVIGRKAWVAAEAFIGPGVEVGDGAVVGARAVVTRSVAAAAVVAGNPARVVRIRSAVQ